MYAFDKMLENLKSKMICTGKHRLKGSFSVICFRTLFA